MLVNFLTGQPIDERLPPREWVAQSCEYDALIQGQRTLTGPSLGEIARHNQDVHRRAGFRMREQRQLCPHEWGEEYHTHLGHKTLGAHSSHRDCLICGLIRTESLGTGEKYSYMPTSTEQSAKRHWRILPKNHKCSAGWRGVVVYQGRQS